MGTLKHLVKLSGLLVFGLCLGGSCAAHPAQVVLVAPSPSPQPEPVTAQAMAAAPLPAAIVPAPTATRVLRHVPPATQTIQTVNPVTLTIVFDNRAFDARLKTAWGFASVIKSGAATILFDTGGDGPMLMNNLDTLGIDPGAIDAVVLSHAHSDHTGGLDQLLAANDRLTVYLPKSFPAAFKANIHNPVIDITETRLIADGVRTTGELGTVIIEQSLIIETQQGSIVLTGCAHPGIVDIVRQAKTHGDVHLVMGGFHLADYSVAEVQAVIAELKALGVQQVAPSHCTGERAIEQFHNAFDTGFIPVGVGAIVHVE